MALQQIGIASEIVNLAFGLLLGAIAVAVAGLGSRDIAAGRSQCWTLLSNNRARLRGLEIGERGRRDPRYQQRL